MSRRHSCRLALSLVVLCLSVVAVAQSSSTTASQALYCVRSKNWLQPPIKGMRKLKMGYVRDVKSYPGEEHWVLAVYQSGSSGQAFDLVRKKFGYVTEFNLVNNGTFSIMKGNLTFEKPPLGGLSTQDQLQLDIQKAMKGRTLIVDTSTLRRRASAVACKSILER